MADNFDIAKGHLVKADNAKVIDFSEVPGSRQKQLTLFWAISDRKEALLAAKYLAISTSTLNGAAARQWVVNPVGSIEEYEGTYRQVSLDLKKHGDQPGIIQVLREGWLQSLPASEDQDDEGRLIGFSTDLGTKKRRLVRAYVNIDREYVQGMEQTRISTKYVTDPRLEVFDLTGSSAEEIGHKTFVGYFQVISRRVQPQEGDIAFALYEELQEVALLEELTDLQALTAEVVQANEVKELFSATTFESDSIALRYRHLSASSRAYCMGEASASLVALVSSGDYPAWATNTVYAVGDRVLQSSIVYLCATAHTAGTFSTDLTAGKWVAQDAWTYADRRFEDSVDQASTLTILLRRENITVIDAFTDLSALTPEIMQGNEIRDVFTTATGEADYIGLRYKNLSASSRSYCSGFAASQLVTLVASGDYPAWVTATAYVVGNRVVQSGTRYICATAHTSDVFATDLAAAKWTALDSWTYAERKFEDSDGQASTFFVLLRREKFQTGTTTADALVVFEDVGLGRTQKAISRVWLRRTKTARDTLIGSGGAARTGDTYLTVAYTHSSVSSNETGNGGWSVTQRLIVPRTSLDIHNHTGAVIIDAHEEILMLTSQTKTRCLVETKQQIFTACTDAYAYADGSTAFFVEETNGESFSVTKGHVKYLGNDGVNDKWAGNCVYITTVAAPPTAWPTTNI